MILRNKRTREMLKIEYSEFRTKFAKEIQIAFDSYRKTQLNKYAETVKPFIDNLSKMSESAYAKYDLALKNGNIEVINKIKC